MMGRKGHVIHQSDAAQGCMDAIWITCGYIIIYATYYVSKKTGGKMCCDKSPWPCTSVLPSVLLQVIMSHTNSCRCTTAANQTVTAHLFLCGCY